MRAVFRRDAEEEFQEATRWYDHQSKGLGIEFMDSIDAAIERIVQQPESYPVVHRKTRMAVVRRFPYLILYRLETSTIVIVAVFHAKRDPRSWKSR